MKIHKSLLPAILLLTLSTIFFEWSNVDILVQDYFYSFESKTWLVDQNEPVSRMIFYSGAKKVLGAFGVLLLIAFIISFKKTALAKYRRQFLLIPLALIFVPSTVAMIKSVSNTCCPWDLQRYGSNRPYVKLFESYPADFVQESPEKCFPAGHPSGGFALMILFFVFKSKKARWQGALSAVTLGWIMAIYQMLKGAHFFSHAIFSMIIAWIIILLIVTVVNYYFNTKTASE